MRAKPFTAGNERDPNHPVHAPTGGRRHHRESEKTLTKEPETLFPHQRCIIDLTEFAHKVSVEVRVYDTEETMLAVEDIRHAIRVIGGHLVSRLQQQAYGFLPNLAHVTPP